MRRPRGRRLLVLLGAATLTTSCGLWPAADPPLPERFTAALVRGDLGAAAGLTDDPAAAVAALTETVAELGDLRLQAELTSSDERGFTWRGQWDLGAGRSVTTNGRAELVDTADGAQARLRWAPSVLHEPLNRGDRLELVEQPAPGARVLDRAGRPLIGEQIVTVVGLADTTPGPALDTALAGAAPLLASVAPGITAETLRRDLPAEGGPAGLAVLRADDAASVAAPLRAVPGLRLSEQRRRLVVDGLRSPALTALTREPGAAGPDATAPGTAVEGGSAGWSVRIRTADGTTRDSLAGADPVPAPDTTLTLDADAQLAAQEAVGREDTRAAALVAIRPSDGGLVAVAQNGPADEQGPIALTGRFPPGSTFKIITAAAVLQAGTVTPDTVLGCPGTENVRGRQIPNDGRFDLGPVPLHTAFAHSCNTTFARLGVDLDPAAFPATADLFGLGPDWTVPGLTTVTGAVPVPATDAETVEQSIGQGRVLASPFGMALVAATTVTGTTPTPTLIQGRPGTGPGPRPAVPEALRTQLTAMMREVVTSGSADRLAGADGVRGKTGTAQYGDGSRSHGWFVATRGDLAVAVLVVDGASSAPAVAVAADFLNEVPR